MSGKQLKWPSSNSNRIEFGSMRKSKKLKRTNKMLSSGLKMPSEDSSVKGRKMLFRKDRPRIDEKSTKKLRRWKGARR